jgi:glucose-6-phosphate isomerase
MRFDKNPFFSDLTAQHKRLAPQRITQLFEDDKTRFDNFSVQAPHIFLDYSKNLVDKHAFDALINAAKACGLEASIQQLFSGEKLNTTEQRPALHTALRDSSEQTIFVNGENIKPEISIALDMMGTLVERLHKGEHKGCTGKPLKQLVSIGIGGSYLGPKTVVEALQAYHLDGLECYFVSNIDGSDLARTLPKLIPDQCIFLVQSKSFGTLETLENARSARRWLKTQLPPNANLSHHFLAVTSNVPAACEFGIPEDKILPMWDWVGGRYSLWSAIGFPIVFLLGMANFQALLRGAEAIDKHFRNTELQENLPVIMALIGIWHRNFFNYDSQAVIPYSENLFYLPSHLQQLDMESNGKRVDRNGEAVNYHTGAIIWGNSGTNGQHAYHQLFHQGSCTVPIDFIAFKTSDFEFGEHHTHLLANCFAQSQALMEGRSLDQVTAQLNDQGLSDQEARKLAPHKVIPGNKPSNTLLLETLNPASVGALIASYEHKVFVQACLWDINPFDQWGVELGKVLETAVFRAMQNKDEAQKLDASTRGLLGKLT